jgi:hypothetical protein
MPPYIVKLAGFDGVVPGVAPGQRIGDKIHLSGLQVHITMDALGPAQIGSPATRYTSFPLRLVFVVDKQYYSYPSVSASSLWAAIFEEHASSGASGYTSFPNVENEQRFDIIHDQIYHQGLSTPVITQTLVDPTTGIVTNDLLWHTEQSEFRFHIPLDHVLSFDVLDAPIGTSIYCLTFTEQSTELWLNTRLHYDQIK